MGILPKLSEVPPCVCTGMGNRDGDHCCYLKGKVCDYLEIGTVPGRKFACGLLRENGTWEKMVLAPRYKPIGDFWAQYDLGFNYCETSSIDRCCGEAR